MKMFILVPVFLLLDMGAIAQNQNPEYDSVLARKLGADEYGMKNYVLVILKTGPAIVEPGPKRDSLFRGHMANISRLAAEGKLLVAGPIGKNSISYRGIFILNVPTIDEARSLLDTDPTVKEKIFDAELFPWYGSAALGEYLQADSKIHKFRH